MSDKTPINWPAEARKRYPLGTNISYPSRAAAENVRRFIHELADAYERLAILYEATCAVANKQPPHQDS